MDFNKDREVRYGWYKMLGCVIKSSIINEEWKIANMPYR